MTSFEHDKTEDTGIKDLTPRGNSEVNRARTRKANAALELAMADVPWTDIAQSLGFPDANRARAAVEKALEDGVFTEDSQARLRQFASKRLNRLIGSVWQRANNPKDPDQATYHARALSTVDRWIKLHGLDAPTQHVISSPSTAQLEHWVSTALQTKQPSLPEGDIFELEPGDYSETVDTG